MKKNIAILVTIFVLAIGCTKDNENTSDPDPDPNPDPSTELTINSKPSFSGIVDNNTISYNEKNSVSVQGASLGVVYYPDTSEFTYDAHLVSLDFETPYISIYIGTLYLPEGGSPTNEQFGDFFNTGHVPYSIDHFDGIEIKYWDENGKTWSTSLGTGDQSNSTFNIDDLKDDLFYNTLNVKFKATLNCKLYDESGNSIYLSNGIFMNYFSNM